MRSKLNKLGFTLVELSIVIVIIGFLVAGIAVGSSMLRQAQIRSVLTDFQSFKSAFESFQSIYNGVPGDISDASSYWPNCAAAFATCNGDDSGTINYQNSNGVMEMYSAVRELYLAGLINSGSAIVDGLNSPLVPGVNAVASRVNGAGYIFISQYFPANTPYETDVIFGKPDSQYGFLYNGVLTPSDAFNMDQKIDDGSIEAGIAVGSQSGIFRAYDGENTLSPTFTDCSNSADNSYTLSKNYQVCIIQYAILSGI